MGQQKTIRSLPIRLTSIGRGSPYNQIDPGEREMAVYPAPAGDAGNKGISRSNRHRRLVCYRMEKGGRGSSRRRRFMPMLRLIRTAPSRFQDVVILQFMF
ncbi:hypothetical protein CFC21_087687 [Triticum aestivum]|uniref:Uncharacterized protein n=2 Tax=Triticum aestivum TaxID=4565 RepID=A0A9R1IIJ0_WHEAT|nr:hypothetical protein CFC21_087687 [Triticum aestivum]